MNTPTSVAIDSQELVTPPLASALDAEVDIEVLKTVPRAFEINSEGAANWLVRKVMSARQYGLHVKEWAERERRRAEREETTLMYLFGRQLERWTKEQIDLLGGRRKSIALPAGGTVGFRSQNAQLIVDDENTVIIWARQNLPDAIRTVETLSKTVLNQHFESTGEIPADGVHVEPPRERFSIR